MGADARRVQQGIIGRCTDIGYTAHPNVTFTDCKNISISQVIESELLQEKMHYVICGGYWQVSQVEVDLPDPTCDLSWVTIFLADLTHDW
jgi:hypothetical protein